MKNNIKFVTTNQLAELLNVSPRTISYWKAQGLIPSIKINRSVRYDYESVVQKIKELEKYG
jgi:DNA-binding transcriptional MerR regulator